MVSLGAVSTDCKSKIQVEVFYITLCERWMTKVKKFYTSHYFRLYYGL